MNLKGKVAIVTGASAGIGLATAKLFAENGVKVAMIARSREKIEEISRQLPESLALECDMTKEDQVRKMVSTALSHYGRVDILLNNAGRGYDAPIEKVDIRKFRDLFELDVVGPLVAMQAAIPPMKQQREGIIVNISSGLALMYLPNMGAYSSLKRALVSLSLTARQELKKDGIVVSVVYPYMTLTDFEKNTVREDFEVEWGEDGDHEFQPPDAAEYVAGKILEAVESGAAEVFAHEWMKGRR